MTDSRSKAENVKGKSDASWGERQASKKKKKMKQNTMMRVCQRNTGVNTEQLKSCQWPKLE